MSSVDPAAMARNRRGGAVRWRVVLTVLLSLAAAGSGALGIHLLTSGRVLASADAGEVPVEPATAERAGERPWRIVVSDASARARRTGDPTPSVPPMGAGAPAGMASSAPGVPVRLQIGTAGGSAPVVPVGVRAGALAIPDSPRTVGWWVGSAPAGARHGSTVLAGHVDSERLGKGTLAILHGLPLGTRIVLTDVFGARHAYAVTARRTYPKDALPADVFRSGDRPRLLLVTCGGPFEQARGHYRDNLVVYALPTT
jgi:Sortase domain